MKVLQNVCKKTVLLLQNALETNENLWLRLMNVWLVLHPVKLLQRKNKTVKAVIDLFGL